jgi:hypothetical protein
MVRPCRSAQSSWLRAFALKPQSNQARLRPGFAPSPIPQVFLIPATALNLHKRFLKGGFLRTAVSDATRTPPEIYLPLHDGARPKQHTSVSGSVPSGRRCGRNCESSASQRSSPASRKRTAGWTRRTRHTNSLKGQDGWMNFRKTG